MSRTRRRSNTELERPRSAEIGSLRLAPSPGSAARAWDLLSTHTEEPTHEPADSGSGSKWDALIKFASTQAAMACTGWSDASSGPLIPYIQAYYGISYTVVSLLFVGQMVGFLTAAFSNGHLSAKFGLGKVIVAGGLIQAVGCALLVPMFPFAAWPICYAVIGFGLALQNAQSNTYIASLPNADHKFAFLHASYGLGAVVCPLAATSFISSGIKFSNFYCISVGVALVNVCLLTFAFKLNFRVEDGHPPTHSPDEISLQDLGTPSKLTSSPEYSAEPTPLPTPSPEVDESVAGMAAAEDVTAVATKEESLLGETLRSKVLWLFASFVILNVGSEVAMGGWIVTFIIDNRHGGPSAGYASTGFWAGLLVGRAVLSWVNVRVGRKRALFAYLALAIALELAIIFADSVVGNAVSVALIGMMLGPAYPLVMTIATKVIPRRLHASSIGFIAAFGQLGAAIFPFATGALAQRFSPAALNPVMITLLGLQLVIWTVVPSIDKKRD